jgi:hypothetical protein
LGGYDYILATNLLIGILVLFAFLVVLLFIFVWKSYLRALALTCSVSIVLMSGGYVQSAIQRYLYITEVLTTPHFDEKCGPAGDILLGGDTLRVCSRYGFGSYAKLIVKISGSYPAERLIDDINSGKIKAPAGVNEWWIAPNTVIGYPLTSDYYLFEVYLCGRGYACGPID